MNKKTDAIFPESLCERTKEAAAFAHVKLMEILSDMHLQLLAFDHGQQAYIYSVWAGQLALNASSRAAMAMYESEKRQS